MKFKNFFQKYLNEFSDHTISDFLNDWKWIIKYTLKRKWSVIFYTVCGILYSTLAVASSYVTSLVINAISERKLDNLVSLILLMIVTTILTLFVNSIKSRVGKKIELDLVLDIQTDLFGNIIELSWQELSKYKNGDLLNRFNKDMEIVMNNAISWIPSIVINIYTFTIIIILLFRMDPVMAWIGLGATPFLFFVSHYLLRKQKQHQNKILEIDSEMLNFESESFFNMDTIKSFGAWDFLSERFTRLQENYKRINLDYNSFQIKTNIFVSLLGTIVALGTLGYCLFRLWTGDILFGDMTFFLAQRSTLTTLFSSLIATIPAMLNASISAHRIREFISLPKEKHDSKAYKSISNMAQKGLSIKIKGLTFSYANEKIIFDDANFSACPGECVAIIGESGFGKTTLFRLILGLIFQESGQIFIKDSNGNEEKINADIRKFISYVPQQNTMMMGTVADNMRIVKKDASDSEIINALKLACAWDFVEPFGINMKIGERGKGISEGQAQRLSIARAILKDAPIMILDEATSALDENTEAKVIENIISASIKKTIILSTHRMSVLENCTKVYKIENKKIALM